MIGWIVFFIILSAAQFALETYKGDMWPQGTGTFPDAKFFYGPALATVVLIILDIVGIL